MVDVLPMYPSSSHWLKESNLPLPTDSTRRCPSQAGGEGKGRLEVLRLLMHCNGALGELVEEASLQVEATLHLSRTDLQLLMPCMHNYSIFIKQPWTLLI